MDFLSQANTRLHIVALEEQFCPIPQFDFGVPYTIDRHKSTASEDVASRIADATILLVTTIRLTAVHLSPQATPQLRLISVMASGTDSIDLEACRQRGIVVCNASRANVAAVSEHAIGLYFAVRRRFLDLHSALLNDKWIQNGTCLSTILDAGGEMPLTCSDETLGLVGYGVIGQRIAELAQGLGMKVLIADRKGAPAVRRGRTDFVEVLERSTVILLILPLHAETRNLISSAELRLMRKTAVIINVARGGIVDEEALITALQTHQIAGAAVDVFKEEPAGLANSPLVSNKKGLNLVLTPHMAWVAQSTLRQLQRITKENAESWVAGSPLNVVK